MVLVGLVACSPDARPVLAPPAAVVEVASFPAMPSRSLDLLLQIDDSGGTAELQASLGAAIPVLLDSLSRIEGGLPDLHLGVVTSDLGTIGSSSPDPAPPVGQVGQGGCAGAGRDGALLTSGASITDVYLIDEADGIGGRRRNYQGALDPTIGQMLAIGSTGCGFEQPLAATRRALTRPDHAGFLRPEASLAIVLVADEDDCSVRDPELFTADENVLGPLQSFRCTRHGLSCLQPLDQVGAKTDCSPREDSPFIEGIEPFEELLRSLKPRREQLVLAGIFGDPSPVSVELRTMNGIPGLALAHSCTYGRVGAMQVADPAVRMGALVDRALSRGVRTTVCETDLSPNLRQIGMAIKRSMGVACIDTSKLADSLDDPGIQPVCEVHNLDRSDLATVISSCPSEGSCYELRADPQACPETADHMRVVVTRDQPPSPGTRVDVRCELASP